MKYIITEQQNLRLSFIRRIKDFEKHLASIVKRDHPCNYENSDEYANVMIESSVLNTLGLEWDDYDSLEEFDYMDYLREKYYDVLVELYDKKNCDD